MTQQLDTNADASANATAMTEDIQQTMADSISALFDRALERLIALRDERYADGIKELELEADQLSKEYAQLEEDIRGIESTLPSRERLVQRQVDELVVNGDPAAKQKFAELAEFKRKPVVMRERQGVIHDRFQSINQEKCDIAKQVFEDWLKVVRPIVRASEHGLLITLLGGLEGSFYQFQASTGTGTSDNRQRPLLNQGHFSGLTADGRSAEWQAGRHWYGR
jgi:hypothetical protein